MAFVSKELTWAEPSSRCSSGDTCICEMASQGWALYKGILRDGKHPIQDLILRSRMSVAQWLHQMSWPAKDILSFPGGKWACTNLLFPACVLFSLWWVHAMAVCGHVMSWGKPTHEIDEDVLFLVAGFLKTRICIAKMLQKWKENQMQTLMNCWEHEKRNQEKRLLRI